MKVAVIVAWIAIIAPILTSLYMSRRQSLSTEQSHLLSYARDTMRRAYETRDEFGQAVRQIGNDGEPPCSPQEMAIMRRIDLTSSYLQAVGRIEGNHLICTSLGTTAHSEVGPPALITENGVAERFDVHLALGGSKGFTIVSYDGVAAVIDPSLILDTPTEGPDISIALFAPSMPGHGLIAMHGKPLASSWLRPIPKGNEASMMDGGYIVAAVRSDRSDLQVVVAAPEFYANRHVRQFAMFFVPLGLLCGAGLVWAILYLSREYFSMPSMLRAAAARNEFYVEYQPIVELAGQRWVKAEALVRWLHNGEVIRPDLFVPAAEESGVITLITQRVAAIVREDLPHFVQIDPAFRIAINVSAADLRSPRTIDTLKQIIHTSGTDASNLEIEATERGLLATDRIGRMVDEIRALGIKVAIDDFGTGYSSLSRVQTLGVDILKVDRTFVEAIGVEGATRSVVPHIVDMAHTLGLEVVAEGVETEAQLRYLEGLGVLYGQGWYFSRAVSAATLTEELRKQRPSRGDANDRLPQQE